MPELVPVEGDPFLEPVEGNPFELGLKSDEGSMGSVVGSVGEHADWEKFQREVRPSENIEDVRGRRQVADPIEAIGQFLDKAAQYAEPQFEPVEGNPFEVQGDVAAAGRKLLAEEMQRRGTMEQLARGLTLPGRVAAGVEPTTPGEWSEEDEFRRQQLEIEAHDWSARQAVRPKF